MFLKQLNTVATEAAQLRALMDQVVPKDMAAWQMSTDIQGLRKDTQSLGRTLRQQKEVSVQGSWARCCRVLLCHAVLWMPQECRRPG